MKLIAPLAAMIALLSPLSLAQPAPVCPPPVLLELARAGSACYNPGQNEACFGSGSVSTTLYGDGAGLVQPGDRADVNLLQTVTVAPVEDGISIATLNVQASLPDAEQKRVTVMAFGAASVENLVPPTPRQILTALGTVNIRRAPALQTEIADHINIGQTLTANGITADSAWLRVNIPNTDELGWVGVEVVSSSGDTGDLSVVTPETPLNQAFELMVIETDADFSTCGGALPAGVLIQTPNVAQPVTMTLNGARFELAGTALVQGASDTGTLAVLEGEAVIDALYVPAGAQISAGAVVPFDATPMAGLPVNNLPRRYAAPPSLTADGIAELTAEYEARVEAVTVIATLAPDTRCRRVTKQTVSLWAGPGTFYEVVNELGPESPVEPVLATSDPDGEVWWQLRGSNWVRARLVAETGECQPIPISDRFTPPRNNTLSLETCLTTNGPLRAGQSVRIEFRPPPFDNLGEARDAVIIDPGRVIIGADTHRASATDPVRLGTVDDRYVRTFYYDWQAVSGTFRIEGDRLTYEPICTITVPVG